MTKHPKPKPAQELGPIQKLILSRAKELGITLQELSLNTTRNRTYVHQFITRNHPRVLPDDVRAVISRMLGIPERDLMPQLPGAAAKEPSPFTSNAAHNQHVDRIPIFEIGETVSQENATDWVDRPGPYAGGSRPFAVWVRSKTGRLMPGDIAFVRRNFQARIGDYAAVLDEDTIVAIGEVAAADDRNVTIKVNNKATTYAVSDFRVMKIAVVVLP